MDELIQAIKDSMRIRHTALDEDIRDDIMAAAADMYRVGVQPYANVGKSKLKKDPLIRKAAELYCKEQASYMGRGDKLESSYEKLRDALSLSGEYHE